MGREQSKKSSQSCCQEPASNFPKAILESVVVKSLVGSVEALGRKHQVLC